MSRWAKRLTLVISHCRKRRAWPTACICFKPLPFRPATATLTRTLTSVTRQRPSQQSASQDQRRQAQAGEENQAAQADVEEARKQMWKTCKGLGWQWKSLADRFKSDHDGRETSQATKAELEAFTAELVREAEEEEDRAKQVVQDQLGGKPIDEAQTTGGVL